MSANNLTATPRAPPLEPSTLLHNRATTENTLTSEKDPRMSATTFQATHTNAHQDAERALRRLIRTLDAALAAEPARSENRGELTEQIDATRRKLRALDAQPSSAAAMWARTTTEQITTLHQHYPELTAIFRRRKAARRSKHTPTTPRGRLRELLTRRLADLADQKKTATGEAKQIAGVEYNRLDNWLNMLDRMRDDKVNEVLYRLEA